MKTFVPKGALNFTHTVKGIGEIKTTCRTFGNPVCKGDTNTLVSLCAKCKQSPDIIQACLVKAGKRSLKPVRVKGER